jgi:hypothetical protein
MSDHGIHRHDQVERRKLKLKEQYPSNFADVDETLNHCILSIFQLVPMNSIQVINSGYVSARDL